nr:hypothetical protein [uncultured Flavobacterium sp.]
MIGVLLIYFIGKYFYDLADQHGQKKWLYAVLGIAVYYLGQFVAGILTGILSLVFGFEVDWDNAILMAVIGIPCGILLDYLFYYFLRKKWQSERLKAETIDDIGQDEI